MNKKNNKFMSTFGKIILLIYLFVALFAPIIANEKPLYITVNHRSFFPAFSNDAYFEYTDQDGSERKVLSNSVDWTALNADNIIFPPVRWSPVGSDLTNSYVSPFDAQETASVKGSKPLPFLSRHFLGTGKKGNDVLSALIHGTRSSLAIGIFAMTIAIFLGLIFGSIAGFYGNDKFKMKRGNIILLAILVLPAYFYSFYIRKNILVSSFSQSFFSGTMQLFISILIFLLILSIALFPNFRKIHTLNKVVRIPVDSIISKVIEIFLSLPRLILILAIAAIIKPSITSIILIIGLTSWTEVARIVRAQMLQLRESEFVMASSAIGNTSARTIFTHIIPNILPSLFIIWLYGVAASILIETGLSFLGIGVPADIATWGSIMYEARENFQAWWLILFAGGAIFLLLNSLYLTAERIKKIRESAYPVNKILTD